MVQQKNIKYMLYVYYYKMVHHNSIFKKYYQFHFYRSVKTLKWSLKELQELMSLLPFSQKVEVGN